MRRSLFTQHKILFTRYRGSELRWGWPWLAGGEKGGQKKGRGQGGRNRHTVVDGDSWRDGATVHRGLCRFRTYSWSMALYVTTCCWPIPRLPFPHSLLLPCLRAWSPGRGWIRVRTTTAGPIEGFRDGNGPWTVWFWFGFRIEFFPLKRWGLSWINSTSVEHIWKWQNDRKLRLKTIRKLK